MKNNIWQALNHTISLVDLISHRLTWAPIPNNNIALPVTSFINRSVIFANFLQEKSMTEYQSLRNQS